MKYIKINTPLQVVGGFTVNEAIVKLIVTDYPDECKVVVNVYKDFNAYNKCEETLIFKADLPDFGNALKFNPQLDIEQLRKHYLSILKANDYDAEIVDTDVAPVEQSKEAVIIKGKLNQLSGIIQMLKMKFSNMKLDFDDAVNINQCFTNASLSIRTIAEAAGIGKL